MLEPREIVEAVERVGIALTPWQRRTLLSILTTYEQRKDQENE